MLGAALDELSLNGGITLPPVDQSGNFQELEGYVQAVRSLDPAIEALRSCTLACRKISSDDRHRVCLMAPEGLDPKDGQTPLWIDVKVTEICPASATASATPEEELRQVQRYAVAALALQARSVEPHYMQFVNVREFLPDPNDPRKVLKTKLYMGLAENVLISLRDGSVSPIESGLGGKLAVPAAHPISLATALIEGVVDPLDGVLQSLERYHSKLVKKNMTTEGLTAEETAGLAVLDGTVGYLHQRTLSMLSATRKVEAYAARELHAAPDATTRNLIGSLDVLGSSIDVYVNRCANLSKGISMLLQSVQARELRETRAAQEEGNKVLELIKNRGGLLAAMAVPIGLGLSAVRTFNLGDSYWGYGIMAASFIVAAGLVLLRNKKIPYIDPVTAGARP